MWTVGEFADLINVPYIDESISINEVEQPLNVSEDKVIDICEEILSNNLMNIVTKEYTIEALMKLSVRFPNHAARVKKLLDYYCCHMNIELQQRSVEFCTLFTKHSNLRPSLLEKMPPLPKINRKDKDSDKGSDNQSLSNGDLLNESLDQNNITLNSTTNKNSNALLDLLGDSIGDIDNNLQLNNSNNKDNKTTVNGNSNILDLLSDLDLNPTTNNNPINNDNKVNNINSQLDIFDSNNEIKLNNSNNQVTNTKTNSSILNDDLFLDIKNLDQTSNSIQTNNKTISNLNKSTVIDKNGLKIVFNFEKNLDINSPITIHLEATNQNNSNITNFLFQAAVPKTFQLTLLPPTSNIIPANNNGSIKQMLKINPSNNLLRMKLKISYNLNDKEFLIEDTKSFEKESWQS